MKHYPYRTFDPIARNRFGTDVIFIENDDIIVRELHEVFAVSVGRKPDNHEAFELEDGTVFYFTDWRLQIYQ